MIIASRSFSSSSQSARARGFTLIEVLVTLIILSVGLLGVAGMQLLSVQNNQGAYLRTQATYIASEFLDRVRANKAGQDVEGYKGGASWPFDTAAGIPGNTANNCATAATGCTAAQLANLDLRDLAANFENVYSVSGYQPMLPNGRAEVNRVDGTDTVEYTVTVYWDERDWDASGGQAVRADSIERFVELRSLIRDK